MDNGTDCVIKSFKYKYNPLTIYHLITLKENILILTCPLQIHPEADVPLHLVNKAHTFILPECIESLAVSLDTLGVKANNSNHDINK